MISEVSYVAEAIEETDRKSTRLNSSHDQISYAVFCLKKKTRSHEWSERPPRAALETLRIHASPHCTHQLLAPRYLAGSCVRPGAPHFSQASLRARSS